MKNQPNPCITACKGLNDFAGNRVKWVILLIFPVIILFYADLLHAQNTAKIDSLLTVLETAKEDTAKANNLYILSMQLITARDYDRAKEYANSALSLSEILNFKFGI